MLFIYLGTDYHCRPGPIAEVAIVAREDRQRTELQWMVRVAIERNGY